MQLWQEWWVWTVAGVALAVLEILAPGYIFLGFAIGAVANGALLWFGIAPASLPCSCSRGDRAVCRPGR